MRGGVQVSGLFFDSPAVLAELRPDTKKVLSRFGYLVMRDGRQAIRRRKRPSDPDETPTNQTDLLKRFIFFSFDPDTKSVVVGPARLASGDPDITEALEHGGITKNKATGKRTRIAARPFMQPAFDRQLQQPLPAPWGK